MQNSESIEAIKQAVSIYDIAASYTNLKGRGDKYKGLCPIHNERNPSFHIDNRKGIFTCFSCGAKGDIFDLVEQKEGIEFKDAINFIVANYLPHLMDGSKSNYKPVSSSKTNSKTTVDAPMKEYTNVPIETVNSTLRKYQTNSLFKALLRYWHEDKLINGFQLYSIGTKRTGEALFWQFAPSGNPCNAKAMQYGTDAKRLKDKSPFYPMAGNTTGLFGARLLHLPEYANAPVCVFESEKTALIRHLSCLSKPIICLGLGGANGGTLTPYLHLLHGRKIYLCPDNDKAGIEGMKLRGKELWDGGIAYHEYRKPELLYNTNAEKVDLADVILETMQNAEPLPTWQYYFESVPLLQTGTNVNILINDKGYPESWQL
jgi:hypothetical protein